MKIAIIGSCSDLEEFHKNKELAEDIGKLIAKNNHELLFSVENDLNSIPVVTAISAKENNGKTIGFNHSNNTKDILNASTTLINTGLQRGGPREHILVMNADIFIVVGGGSGTLVEIAMAYQQNKRIILFKNTGGWADKLNEDYLDGRRRVKLEKVNTLEELEKLISN